MHELLRPVFGLLHVLPELVKSNELRDTKSTYLSTDLEDVLERHARIRQLALQKHYDVMVMFIDLLRLW